MKETNLTLKELEDYIIKRYPFERFTRDDNNTVYSDTMPFLAALDGQAILCDAWFDKDNTELVIHFKLVCFKEFKSLYDQWLEFEHFTTGKAEHNGTFLYVPLEYYSPRKMTWETL